MSRSILSGRTWTDETSQLALFINVEAEVEGEVALESAGVDKGKITVKLDDIKIKVSWVKRAKIVAKDGTEEFRICVPASFTLALSPLNLHR